MFKFPFSTILFFLTEFTWDYKSLWWVEAQSIEGVRSSLHSVWDPKVTFELNTSFLLSHKRGDHSRYFVI